MKFPEQQKFTIPELAGRWKETENKIFEMAADGQLELRVLVSGYFPKSPAALPDAKAHDSEEVEREYNLDCKISDPDMIRVIAKNDFFKQVFVEKTIDDIKFRVLPLSERVGFGVPNWSQIQKQDLYVPLSSVLRVEEQIIHRVILEEMLTWLNMNKGTNDEFASWLNGRYSTISKTVAKNLYTFLTINHTTK